MIKDELAKVLARALDEERKRIAGIVQKGLSDILSAIGQGEPSLDRLASAKATVLSVLSRKPCHGPNRGTYQHLNTWLTPQRLSQALRSAGHRELSLMANTLNVMDALLNAGQVTRKAIKIPGKGEVPCYLLPTPERILARSIVSCRGVERIPVRWTTKLGAERKLRAIFPDLQISRNPKRYVLEWLDQQVVAGRLERVAFKIKSKFTLLYRRKETK